MRAKPPRWPVAPSWACGESGSHESPAIARQDPCRSPSHGAEVCRVAGSPRAPRAGAVGNWRHQGDGHFRRLGVLQQRSRRPGRWRSPSALGHIRSSAEEWLLRTYPAAHGDIDGHCDDIGFGVWYASLATPEGEVQYKHVLELGQVWRDRYAEGYRQGYDASYSKLLDTLGGGVVLVPNVHLEDCAGPGRRSTSMCWCHAWGWRT